MTSIIKRHLWDQDNARETPSCVLDKAQQVKSTKGNVDLSTIVKEYRGDFFNKEIVAVK